MYYTYASFLPKEGLMTGLLIAIISRILWITTKGHPMLIIALALGAGAGLAIILYPPSLEALRFVLSGSLAILSFYFFYFFFGLIWESIQRYFL